MPAGSGDNKHEGWNTIPPFLAGPGHHVQQCIEPKVATLQDPIPSRVDFLMDHSMGWLSRFFSTKSGGTIPLPIQCIVKLGGYGGIGEHNQGNNTRGKH